ncbi:MAG: hypothetical protein NC089_13530 [Bacteroides sp.]|nr:hypothetical protein [Bacteroides sp.]MCM1551012.1 hypothetical protein [Clostridium sp.]
MKKKLWVMLGIFLLLFCAGCGDTGGNKGNGTTQGPAGVLSDIVEQIYEQQDPGLGVETIPVDLSNADMVKIYTGLDSAEAVSEAVASESLMGAQAYSLVLVRVWNADEAAEVAKAMREGIDQRKWVCVEADDLQVVGCGDVVMLFMVSSEFADTVTSADMVEAFKKVCGGTLTVE